MSHGLLFKQLSSWMLHGMTSDPYNEFFVQLKNKIKETPASQTTEDDEEELGIMGLTGRQLQVKTICVHFFF